MEEEDDFESEGLSQSHFRPAMRKKLEDPALALSKALESGQVNSTYDAFYRLLRPVAFELILKVPDKSRLDIPVDTEALQAFLFELTAILFEDLTPLNKLQKLKGIDSVL